MVMSFAYLKNKRKDKKVSDVVETKPKSAKEICLKKETRSTPAKNSLHKDKSTGQVDLFAKIMESKHCYGCEMFSVDSPDTPRERGWCKRKTPEGEEFEFVFKKIPVSALVRQCPKIKNRQK